MWFRRFCRQLPLFIIQNPFKLFGVVILCSRALWDWEFWTPVTICLYVKSHTKAGDIIEPVTHCNYKSNAQSLRPSYLSTKNPVSFHLFAIIISIQFQLSPLMENHCRGNSHLIPTHLVRNDYYGKHAGKWQKHTQLSITPNIVFPHLEILLATFSLVL